MERGLYVNDKSCGFFGIKELFLYWKRYIKIKRGPACKIVFKNKF
jgi:hypothetical protein